LLKYIVNNIDSVNQRLHTTVIQKSTKNAKKFKARAYSSFHGPQGKQQQQARLLSLAGRKCG